MSTTILETDVTCPSVPLISSATLFSGKKLDKLKGNWEEWKDGIYPAACLSGLWAYMSGTSLCPDQPSEPQAHSNWIQNDEGVCALIYDTIEPSEQLAVAKFPKGAKDFWKALLQRHKKTGPVSQVYLIKDALGKCASVGDEYTKGLNDLFNMLERAWRMGDITLDLFKSIIALNYFSKANILNIQFDLQTCIDNATKNELSPLQTFKNLLRNDKKHKDNNVCTNCKKLGHTVQYCISPNGGMAGKTITKSKAQHMKDREAKNPKPTTSTSTNPTMITWTVKDESTGAMYPICMPEDAKPVQTHTLISVSLQTHTCIDNIDTMVYSTDDLERGEAVWGYSSAFMAIGEAPFTQAPTEAPVPPPAGTTGTSPPPHPDHTNLPPAEHICDWSTDDGCFHASIDWNVTSHQVDITAIIVKLLHQSQATPISTDTCPFYVDTRATAHISPDHTDFITLCPISAHTIKGVGGSFITAIGCGDIKLRISQGKYLIL
ncbi:hypothetical protein NLJ89_g9412 [Agrocybe chaxingu]|uniref:Retrovirus-related Pol polyprotein from transposon TNT 1-94-like beta-barrel domain-containing protein n=1 Tax=Agrocybe chaxingu TaxID=84603 RepID=A0A9W8MTK2_9AGAR|nr:hypothetical protein NLJ89_g9412 [Agrocybe chaxingu]